jgi:hypothetical protein
LFQVETLHSLLTESIYTFPELHAYLINPNVYLNSKKLLLELNNFYTQVEKGQSTNFLCGRYVSEQLKYLNLDSVNTDNSTLAKELKDFIPHKKTIEIFTIISKKAINADQD